MPEHHNTSLVEKLQQLNYLRGLSLLMSKSYIIYNSNLPMSKGKLMSQCCHAQHTMTINCERNPSKAYLNWCNGGQKTICLKANSKVLLDLSTKPDAIPIFDAGCTEIYLYILVQFLTLLP
jgi:peptidyl-tRNA hydrolase